MMVSRLNAGEVFPPERLNQLDNGVTTIGIDIGSRQSKAVLLHNDEMHTAICASGVDSHETAERLIKKLLRGSAISREQIAWVVGTGYGRVSMQFDDIPSGVITEITCHAMGAHFLNAGTKTIIDIGGQDCKAIKVDPENGNVVEFVMNDKCAAGTGRFLEKTAEMLGYSLEELGDRALESRKKLEMSSQCVVFAESEIISLKARGEHAEDIAAGIHYAAARRVKNLVSRIGLDPELVFSGGVSSNQGMKRALEELLKHPIKTTSLDTVYCGALGASIIAQRMYRDADSTAANQENMQ